MPAARGVWEHTEVLTLKRYSCVLRGRFLSKMFAKSIDIFVYFYLRVFTYKHSFFVYISGGIFKFFGYQFQLRTLC